MKPSRAQIVKSRRGRFDRAINDRLTEIAAVLARCRQLAARVEQIEKRNRDLPDPPRMARRDKKRLTIDFKPLQRRLWSLKRLLSRRNRDARRREGTRPK